MLDYRTELLTLLQAQSADAETKRASPQGEWADCEYDERFRQDVLLLTGAAKPHPSRDRLAKPTSHSPELLPTTPSLPSPRARAYYPMVRFPAFPDSGTKRAA